MTQPPLFEFSLDALDDVHAWGVAPNQTLSWFGLTQGRYRLNAGRHRLLNYSDGMVAKHAADWPEAYPGPFVDYYVVRLWEDLLWILPDVLAPLPCGMHEIMLRADAERNAWAEALARSMPDDAFLDATGWVSGRILDSGYLQHAPWLRLWTCAGQTFIAWDCIRLVKDGVPIWSATAGHHAMPTDAFLAEVADFNARLITGMAERVDAVVGGWCRSNVTIDVPGLTREHGERTMALDAALARPPTSFERGRAALGIEA